MGKLHGLLCLVLIISLVSGCTSSTKNLLDNGTALPQRVVTAYDPFAPMFETPKLDAALAVAPFEAAGFLRYTALDNRNQPAPGVMAAVDVSLSGNTASISLNRSLTDVSLYITYEASKLHLAGSTTAQANAVSLITEFEPGWIAVGSAAIGDGVLNTDVALAELSFAPGASTVARQTSAVSTDERSAVRNLQVADNTDGSATLQWAERHTGDYDLNSEVNIADLTPIGANFKEVYTESDNDFAKLEVVDGDENGEINIADLTPIGKNFRTQVAGYNVYRIALTDPEEIPVVGEGNWQLVENTSEPSGPSAPRQGNGQDFRLVYNFIDNSDYGIFGWYVVATDGTDEGPASNVVTLPVGGLFDGPWLNFIVQAPDNTTLNVNDEFWVGVVAHDVEGLFSANVRFEYDSTALEFIEAQSAYEDTELVMHANLLVPPLFLSADDLAEPADYKLLGFNATQTQGEPGKDGEGAVGYIKFRALAAGEYEDAIRFPQATNFIFLWGEQYGVPLIDPVGLAFPLDLTIN